MENLQRTNGIEAVRGIGKSCKIVPVPDIIQKMQSWCGVSDGGLRIRRGDWTSPRLAAYLTVLTIRETSFPFQPETVFTGPGVTAKALEAIM
jgi:hypothetical protein